MQRQKAAEEKAKQERADEELARQLAAEIQQSAAPRSSADSHMPSQNNISAYDRLMGAPSSQLQYTFGQPSSSQSSLVQPAQYNTTGTHTFGSSSVAALPHAGNTAVKPEPHSLPHLSIPGSFPRDGTSDSDSSIEMIPSSAFQDNGRHQRVTQSYGPPPASAGQAALGSVYGGTFSASRANAMNPHLQYGAQHNPPNRHGISLPRPVGMGPQQPGGILGYSPYSQASAGRGSRNYSNGNGNVSGLDPLRDMIKKTANIDWNTMTDGYGNPVDSRLNEISDYINDPRKTQQEIQDLLENIRSDEEIPKENREGTPDGLKYPLYEHQKLALTWMKKMEEGTNKGGILADDMGLGKTISALALILSRPSTDRLRKVHFTQLLKLFSANSMSRLP